MVDVVTILFKVLDPALYHFVAVLTSVLYLVQTFMRTLASSDIKHAAAEHAQSSCVIELVKLFCLIFHMGKLHMPSSKNSYAMQLAITVGPNTLAAAWLLRVQVSFMPFHYAIPSAWLSKLSLPHRTHQGHAPPSVEHT